MARGTQHRKRRPTANAAVAPSAKVKTKKPKRGQLGRPALLRAAAPPRQVGLRLPRGRLRLQLRPLRRRLRLDRDRRRAQQLLRGHLQPLGEQRLVGGLAREEDARASQGREGLARARHGAGAEGEPRRGDRRADALHGAEAQGRGPALGARRAVPAAGRRVRAAVRRRRRRRHRRSSRAPTFKPPSSSPLAQALEDPISAGDLDLDEHRHDGRLLEVHRHPEQGGRRVQEARRR